MNNVSFYVFALIAIVCTVVFVRSLSASKRIIAGTKRRVLKEGVILEQFTFEDWIRHIETLE